MKFENPEVKEIDLTKVESAVDFVKANEKLIRERLAAMSPAELATFFTALAQRGFDTSTENSNGTYSGNFSCDLAYGMLSDSIGPRTEAGDRNDFLTGEGAVEVCDLVCQTFGIPHKKLIRTFDEVNKD